MLVLSRKANETILLGDDIRVVVLSVEGERVRIGIDAPRALRIIREELILETKGINQEAATAPVFSLRKK